jgi:hypothetical protein
MLAALARREQLASRIAEVDPRAVPRIPAPASLEATVTENAQLERVLASLEERAPLEHDADDEDYELPPVVDDDDKAPLQATTPLDGRGARQDHLRRMRLTLGVFVPIALVGLVVSFALEPSPAPMARPPREETTVRLTGVVVSRAGGIDVHEGERCELVVSDSGEREAGRACTVEARCARVSQRFIAASCPIGGPTGSVRMESNGLEIDGVARTATFMAGWSDGMFRGGATLRLDPTPAR